MIWVQVIPSRENSPISCHSPPEMWAVFRSASGHLLVQLTLP
jgi:hypothetical protein